MYNHLRDHGREDGSECLRLRELGTETFEWGPEKFIRFRRPPPLCSPNGLLSSTSTSRCLQWQYTPSILICLDILHHLDTRIGVEGNLQHPRTAASLVCPRPSCTQSNSLQKCTQVFMP